MTSHKNSGAVSWCEVHEKLLYRSRKEGRKAARQHVGHKVAYRCSVKEDYYHIGELPEGVVTGRITRDRLVEKVS